MVVSALVITNEGMLEEFRHEIVREFYRIVKEGCRSHWPHRLKRRSVAARLLGLWVRIPPGAWISVSCDCCVLSGRERSLRRADQSSRGAILTVVRRWVWSRNLKNEEALAHWGLLRQNKKRNERSVRCWPIKCTSVRPRGSKLQRCGLLNWTVLRPQHKTGIWAFLVKINIILSV